MGTRRDGAARAIVAVGSLFLLLLAGGAPAGVEQTRPNVVVIMTDDQTLESLRVMTNVRRLIGAQGATFQEHVASFPLCCPSRAAFLTGRYSHNSGVLGNAIHNGLGRLDEANTLPVWLRESGYSTIFVGKYLNNYGRYHGRAIPPGWTEWYAGTNLAYYRHTMNRNGRIVRYGTDPGNYQSDVFTRTAVDAVRRHAGGSTPFFLWLSYFAPHHGGPREVDDPPGMNTPVPAARHRDRFALEPMPQTPAFDEVDLGDKPLIVRGRPPLDQERLLGLEEGYRQRLESLLAVDEGVAQLLAALRAARVLDRTYVFFTSDNGYLEGEHRIVNAKEHLYEPSIRVPLLVRGPGIQRGIRLRQPTVNVDLAPTIAAAAQALPSIPPDGRSLLPLLADPTLEWGRDVLLERGPGAGLTGLRLYTALRTPRYVYAEHATGERELYDLAVDPYELASRHDDPEYAAIREVLAARLARLRDCVGAACAQGPELALDVRGSGGCVSGASVRGGDEKLVARVDLVETGPRVRAQVELVDGRRVTLTATARRCS